MKINDLEFIPAECCGNHFTATVLRADGSYLEVRRESSGVLVAVMKSADGRMLRGVTGIEDGLLIGIDDESINSLLGAAFP